MGSPKEFHGGVFAESLPGGRAPARIDVLTGGLRASTNNNQVFELAFDSMELELGGASGRMMFCRNADRTITLFCEERGFIFALTRLAGKHVKDQLAPMQTRLRTRFVMRVAATIVLGAAALGALWALPSMVRWSLASAVHTVPFSVDEQLGASAMAHMDLGGPTVQQPEMEAALQTILSRLAAHSTMPDVRYKPHIINRDTVNAFALPGGPVVVYTGLLHKAAAPEAVAAVLAHEMAHVIHRHGLERIAQSMGIVATMHIFFGDVAGLLAVGKELLTTAAVNRYSRGEEAEADRTAVDLLQKAAINPQALADFFTALEKEPQAGADPWAPAWLSDHPALADRIASTRAAAAAQPQGAWQPVLGNWNALQAQLPH